MGEKTRRGSSAASARAVASASLSTGIGAAIVARSQRAKTASPIAILKYETHGRNGIGRRQLHPTAEPQERAFLVAAQLKHWGSDRRGTNGIGGRWNAESSLEELALLADTAGARIVGQTVQRLDSRNPATYVGKGKVAEIASQQAELNYSTV